MKAHFVTGLLFLLVVLDVRELSYVGGEEDWTCRRKLSYITFS